MPDNMQPHFLNKKRGRVFSWVRFCCIDAILTSYSWFKQPVMLQYVTSKVMIFGRISSNSPVPPHCVTDIWLFFQYRIIIIETVNPSSTECSNPLRIGKLTLVFRINKMRTADCLFSGWWWCKIKNINEVVYAQQHLDLYWFECVLLSQKLE